jgi:hypothetical protein
MIEILLPNGSMLPLHALEDGAEGEIVVTIPGALPRYRLGDRVRVEGRWAATPCLDFRGRVGEVADLAGEKLDGGFVASVLVDLLPEDCGAAILLPWRGSDGQGYVLAVDKSSADLATRGDAALMAAFHYRQARRLGQLTPLRTLEEPRLAARVQAFFVARGMAIGDIKDRVLIADVDLASELLDALQPEPMSAQAAADCGANRP